MPRGDCSGCETCHGRCCRELAVPVCGFDVVRLARAEQLPIDNFATLATEAESSRGSVHLHSGDETFYLKLQRRYARDGGPACVFLMELEGDYRCGVYGHRPQVCRTYPMQLHHGAVRVRPDAICGADAWNVAGLDLPGWRQAVTLFELEWTVYDIVLRRFNDMARERGPDDPLTEADFFAWLSDAYAAIDPLREALGEEQWATTAPDLANAAVGRPGPAADLLAAVGDAVGAVRA